MRFRSTEVRLIGPPEADGEYVGLRESGSEEELVQLHDYARLYRVSGLYEYIVQEMLSCRSPQVTAEALARGLKRLALDPTEVRLLDLGAGTGLVGELVRGLGIASIVGLDALEAARQACLRDRPGVYRDYLTGDLAEPGLELLSRLRHHEPSGLVAAGAFGGTHVPASALLNALALLPPGAPVVFTIDERWVSTDAPGGFRTPVTRLLASGELRLLERSRFQHRLTTSGEPVTYELLAAAKGPAAYLRPRTRSMRRSRM